MKNIRLILFYSAFMVLGAAAIGTAANLPQQGAPRLPAAQPAQQQPAAAPAGALDTLQSPFTVTPQQAFQKTIHITGPGVVTITAAATGAPVVIRVAGQFATEEDTYLGPSEGTGLSAGDPPRAAPPPGPKSNGAEKA